MPQATRLHITKMHGAGNDFVVLDATKAPLGLSAAQFRWLADRHRGVGADQILIVGPSPEPGIDFSYRIVNADGNEVQHCGNGARCFVRYVRSRGLTQKLSIRVRTVNADLTLTEQADGRVRVNMGEPRFDPASLPFDASGFGQATLASASVYGLPIKPQIAPQSPQNNLLTFRQLASEFKDFHAIILIAIASMGNPHAVVLVDDTACVNPWGPWLCTHPAFAQQVNAGFMQVVSRQSIRLRVHERGSGETLACGTGACAAVACGIQMGLLDADTPIDVQTRGGPLKIEWAGPGHPLYMTGPATTVFEADIDLPALPQELNPFST